MKKFLKKVRGEKVKVGGQGQQWWFAFLIAAATLVAPLASNASEFPGMGAAYAQRLEQYRKISSLWLAPQVLLSKVQEPPGPPLITQHSYFNTSLASLPSRVSIEPNNSSVSHGLTPSNSYLIAWQNACVERSSTNRVDATIELFPDGSVTTIWQPLNPNQQPITNNRCLRPDSMATVRTPPGLLPPSPSTTTRSPTSATRPGSPTTSDTTSPTDAIR